MGFEFTPEDIDLMSILHIGGFYTNRSQVGLNNNNKGAKNMVYPIFKAGKVGFSMLRYLYKGGSKAKKFVGFTDKAKKLEKSVKLVQKWKLENMDSQRVLHTVKGGLGNRSKMYAAHGMMGVAE